MELQCTEGAHTYQKTNACVCIGRSYPLYQTVQLKSQLWTSIDLRNKDIHVTVTVEKTQHHASMMNVCKVQRPFHSIGVPVQSTPTGPSTPLWHAEESYLSVPSMIQGDCYLLAIEAQQASKPPWKLPLKDAVSARRNCKDSHQTHQPVAGAGSQSVPMRTLWSDSVIPQMFLNT